MRIRNNQNASFALRYTSANRSALMKSLEKLSSGYAINRAGDDAAGLTISEKMRRQITGLKRADKNSQEGVKLIQVGEGALDEIHSMLQRAESLADQSANGVYEDEIDREALQAELDQLCEDIGRIAKSTNFNGVKLFQDRGLEYERTEELSGNTRDAARQEANAGSVQIRRTLDDLIRDEDKGELNIVYVEYPIDTTQAPGTGSSGVDNSNLNIDINGTKISEILKTQIVPQTVNNILTNYPAFSYLKGSAIGIGMKLYSDSSSNVLASVSQGAELFSNGTGSATYTLSVNIGKVDTSKSDWREDLESTIAHEMIHAFMFEATTAGMHGLAPGTSTSAPSGKFPSWFVEGMAQTASGPDTWIHPGSSGGLRIDASSNVSQIQSEIRRVPLGSSGGGDYGTGYLACMYLGWAIAGGGSTAVNAANISRGLSSLLNEVIGGSSLNAAISKLTNNKFTSTDDFKNRFNAADTEVAGFVRNLMVARGSGRGGLASGDLTTADLTNDASLVGVKLFELNTATSDVKNVYPSGYVITTGGTTSASGTKPSDFTPQTPSVPVTQKLFTVTGGTEGTDYEYDGNTLVIKTNQVTAITNAPGAGSQGRIKIADNIKGPVSLELNGVDCSMNTSGSGFDLGKGNNVTLSLKDGTENKFSGASNYAGISVGTGTKLTIDGDTGKLTSTGGTGAAGIGRNAATVSTNGTDKTSSITINGGDITAKGSSQGAGIGAGYYNDIGDITVTGGKVTATGGNQGGAGIGGASYADCGNIKIDESSGKKTTVTAISLGHGAGIGGGWYNTVNGTITISAGKITARSQTHGTGIGAGCQGGRTFHSESGKVTITGTAVIEEAIGGNESAGIGSSWLGTCAEVEISGNAVVNKAQGGKNGAGIGSGSGSHIGNIVINTTGEVHAQGGENGVGIGSGYGGTTYGSGTKYGSSTVGDIVIKKGIVEAVGGENSTGIGAGRDSTSGNVTIGGEGNSNNMVVVTAKGGMSNNGGNIMAYADPDHTKPGTVKIVGSGTTVRPGETGEGLYSTSGATGGDNRARYAYPVYLFHTSKNTDKDKTLNAGVGLNAATSGKLPLDKDKIDLSSIKISDQEGNSWDLGLSHDPLDSDYVFVWLRPRNQTLTIEYKEKGSNKTEKVELDLIYYPTSGVFRLEGQKVPPEAVPPGYDGKPGDMPPPQPDWEPEPPEEDPQRPEDGAGGIILQIGAEYGEILTVPQFYLSLDALNMGSLDISTQSNAWESMSVVRDAINRVSSIRATYGALYNRLEHNQNQLRHMAENITDAESRIRDTDMAEEMMAYTKASILSQSAQAMLAQAAQQPESILRLLG